MEENEDLAHNGVNDDEEEEEEDDDDEEESGEGEEEEEEEGGEALARPSRAGTLVLSSVNLYDKDILKGFRIHRFVAQLLDKVIEDAVQEAECGDEVDVSVREETRAMQDSMMEMGIMGELPLTFGSLKARQAASASSSRATSGDYARAFPVGSRCECQFPEDGLYYPAKVEAHLAHGKVRVSYEGYDDTRPVRVQWLRPLPSTTSGSGGGGNGGQGVNDQLPAQAQHKQQEPKGNKHIRFDNGNDEEEEEGQVEDKQGTSTTSTTSNGGPSPPMGSFGSELAKLKQAFRTASSSAGGGGGGAVVEVHSQGGRQSKKRRRNTNSSMFPADGKDEDPPVDVPLKYWMQRFRYFSQFDRGTKMDAEGWYSATPERIAQHIAERSRCDVVVDLFTGCGGNAIQFAMTCNHVIAIDIDPKKLECARHNARIYGVEDRIEFILGDAIKILPSLKAADVIFMSPPWGGPEYMDQEVYALDTIRCPVNGVDLLNMALDVCPNVAYFLPKNVDMDQVAGLARGKPCEIEDNLLNYKLKTKTVYFGGEFLPPPQGSRRKKKRVKRQALAR